MKTIYHMKYALTGGVERIQIDQEQSEELEDKAQRIHESLVALRKGKKVKKLKFKPGTLRI